MNLNIEGNALEADKGLDRQFVVRPFFIWQKEGHLFVDGGIV